VSLAEREESSQEERESTVEYSAGADVQRGAMLK